METLSQKSKQKPQTWELLKTFPEQLGMGAAQGEVGWEATLLKPHSPAVGFRESPDISKHPPSYSHLYLLQNSDLVGAGAPRFAGEQARLAPAALLGDPVPGWLHCPSLQQGSEGQQVGFRMSS